MGALAVGCPRSPTETGEDPSETGDTAQPGPCDVEVEPSGYTNDEYLGADCAYDGLGVAFDEYGSVNLSEDHGRMTYQWTYASGGSFYPGYAMFVNWYEDRGASLYPGESLLYRGQLQDTEVQVFIADCPGDDSTSCRYFLATSGRVFFSEGGRCRDTEFGDPDGPPLSTDLVGFVDQLVFEEVDMDPPTGSSEWIADPEYWCVDRVDFDVYLNYTE